MPTTGNTLPPPIQPGDVLTAGRLNELSIPGRTAHSQLSGLSGSGGVSASMFPGGSIFKGGFNPGLVLYELTEQLTYPTDTKSAPFADNCTPVIHDLHADQEILATETLGQTLYFPNALRDASDDYIKLPLLADGTRVWAWLNEQSGRLEIVENEHEYSYWGKLTGALPAGGTAPMDVFLDSSGTWDATSGVNITVYSPPVAASEIASTSWVGVKWHPEYRRFVVVEAPC